MRLYIAGPMTGLPERNYPAFMGAERHLAEAGYEVENPATNKPAVEGTPTWLDFMRMSLVQISRCDGIATLSGWERSNGACVEVALVVGLGLPVKNVATWVKDAEIAPYPAYGISGYPVTHPAEADHVAGGIEWRRCERRYFHEEHQRLELRGNVWCQGGDQ